MFVTYIWQIRSHLVWFKLNSQSGLANQSTSTILLTIAAIDFFYVSKMFHKKNVLNKKSVETKSPWPISKLQPILLCSHFNELNSNFLSYTRVFITPRICKIPLYWRKKHEPFRTIVQHTLKKKWAFFTKHTIACGLRNVTDISSGYSKRASPVVLAFVFLYTLQNVWVYYMYVCIVPICVYRSDQKRNFSSSLLWLGRNAL